MKGKNKENISMQNKNTKQQIEEEEEDEMPK